MNKPMDETRAPSMFDVARLADVSHQTVSRVLNGASNVRPETADRVRAAITELGYRPNRAARALATARSGLIGVLAAGFPHMGPASTVEAIETATRRAGFSAVVSVHAFPTAEAVRASVRSFVEHGVQGIAVVSPRQAVAESALAEAHGIPTVLIADAAASGLSDHLVSVDQELGARLVTEHVLAGGARSVAHISGPAGWFDADRRVTGWRGALHAAGLDTSALYEGDWGAARGLEIGRDLARFGLPDAVFCGNDLTAIGLLAAFRERGIRVPQDVAVAGFDDIATAAYVDPPLTTVRQPFDDLGELAVATLLRAITGKDAPAQSLAPELIVRASTRSVTGGEA